MRLAETNYDNSGTGCCAELDPTVWDEKEFRWEDKLFLEDHIRALFHLPLNFGSVVSRDHEIIEEAEAYPADPVWLTDEVSPWGSDIHVAVDREIPGAEIVKMSGTFLTKVFEGPYRNAGKWAEAMEKYVREKGRTLDEGIKRARGCPTVPEEGLPGAEGVEGVVHPLRVRGELHRSRSRRESPKAAALRERRRRMRGTANGLCIQTRGRDEEHQAH